MQLLLSSVADYAQIPGGFWTTLWSWLLLAGGSPLSSIVNYGVRVIVFTLFLKLLLSPLDIYQRIRMRKNQQITESLKPEIEKLEKQFGGNPQMLQKKKQELNKKNGVKMMAGCLPMFVTMVVSIWVLMGGLNPISQYQNMMQYLHLFDAFTVAEQAAVKEIAQDNREVFYLFDSYGQLIEEEYPEWQNVARVQLRGPEAFYTGDASAEDLNWNYPQLEGYRRQAVAERNNLQARIIADSTAAGQQAAVDRYFGYGIHYGNPARDGFLWVQNIWVSDVPWEQTIRDAAGFSGAIGGFREPERLRMDYEEMGFSSQAALDAWFEDTVIGSYDRVMGLLIAEHSRRNGLLILPILSILVMIGSQILTRRIQKKSGMAPGMGMGGMPGMPGAGGAGGGMLGKMMGYAMPVIFGLFSLGFTAAFAIYMVINSMFMILITLLSTGLIALLDKRSKKEKVTETGTIKYGRKDPNEVAPKAQTRNERKGRK